MLIISLQCIFSKRFKQHAEKIGAIHKRFYRPVSVWIKIKDYRPILFITNSHVFAMTFTFYFIAFTVRSCWWKPLLWSSVWWDKSIHVNPFWKYIKSVVTINKCSEDKATSIYYEAWHCSVAEICRPRRLPDVENIKVFSLFFVRIRYFVYCVCVIGEDEKRGLWGVHEPIIFPLLFMIV